MPASPWLAIPHAAENVQMGNRGSSDLLVIPVISTIQSYETLARMHIAAADSARLRPAAK